MPVNSAREKFIEENVGLVHLCANRFKGRGAEYDDLFQAGCVGLVKAYDAFDFERGTKFSTYAVPVILGEIKRIFRDGGAVKVSRRLKEVSLRVARAKESFRSAEGRDPAISELSEVLEIEEETITCALEASRPPISLTVDDEEDDTRREIELKQDDGLGSVSDSLALKEALSRLDANDRRLIILRYFNEKTQSDTAKIIGGTQVQVSRREKKILEQLRTYMGV